MMLEACLGGELWTILRDRYKRNTDQRQSITTLWCTCMEQGYKQSVLSSVCQFVSVRPPRLSKWSACGSICVHLHTCMKRPERVPTAFSAYQFQFFMCGHSVQKPKSRIRMCCIWDVCKVKLTRRIRNIHECLAQASGF